MIIRYSYSVSATVLDVDSLCQSNSHEMTPFFVNWYDDFSSNNIALPPPFMRRHKQITLGTDIGRKQICADNIAIGVAVVKFELATRTVTQIEKTLRYSIADYLSNMGRYIHKI